MSRPAKSDRENNEYLSAVYKIQCEATGRTYVGSTMKFDTPTTDLNNPETFARWKTHLAQLRDGKHLSDRMQSDYNKFGAASFRFEILEWTTSSKIDDRELYWQKRLHPEYSRDYLSMLGKRLVEEVEFTDLVKVAEGKSVIVEKGEMEAIMQRLDWLEKKVSVIDRCTRKDRRRVAVPGQLEITIPS